VSLGAGRLTTSAPPRVIETKAALQAELSRWRDAGKLIGLVPTMGALHDGHLSLIRRAKAECGCCLVSLFVNPMQFNQKADLANYPQRLEEDMGLLTAEGVDLLYKPGLGEIYPEGFSTRVLVEQLTDGLCGTTRPGHFDGVATVVAKLLIQSWPARAYFGEKDYQQLQIVTRMARDLDLPCEIVGCPTVREADGLALSSRNFNLDADARRRAPALYRELVRAAESLATGSDWKTVSERARVALADAGFEKIDYFDLRDAESLAPCEDTARPCRLFAAAWLGAVRLIDNIPVATKG
jgi:pantoate--beta-alanine ligase